jgi:hemerythrin
MYKWSDKYVTGHRSIDEQHEELFLVIESVEKMVTKVNKVSSDRLSDAFEGLLNYTIYHFATEEDFWQTYDHALYEYQKKEHASFISQLERVDVRLIETDGQAWADALMVQLSNWVVNHVETEIVQIKEILKIKNKV